MRNREAMWRAQIESEVDKQEADVVQQDSQGTNDFRPVGPRGVIYMGSIPEGFNEPQVNKYFSQFGEVTRLRLARSKKTARCKGYGWVEFKEMGVAEIAAETMNGYVMFGTRLKCHVAPADKVHPDLFRGWLRRKTNKTNLRRESSRDFHNQKPTIVVDGETLLCKTERQVKRERDASKDKKLKELIKTLEIDFDPDAATEQSPQKKRSTAQKGTKRNVVSRSEATEKTNMAAA